MTATNPMEMLLSVVMIYGAFGVILSAAIYAVLWLCGVLDPKPKAN